MDIFDRATPRLANAHHKLWHVREACHDEIMEAALARAIVAIQDAQSRLRMIEREARAAGTGAWRE
jgi:hypothetical protein